MAEKESRVKMKKSRWKVMSRGFCGLIKAISSC